MIHDILSKVFVSASAALGVKLVASSGVDIGNVGIGSIASVDGQAAMAASLPVVIASDQSSVPVNSNSLSVTATLTVTNGLYTAQDVVGGLITLASAVRANGKSSILNSLVLTGMTSAISFELWLLNADLVTPIADNGAFAIVAADQPKVLGVIPIGSADQYQAGASGVYAASIGALGKQVKAGAATTSIFGYLKHTTTTTPGTTTLYLTAQFEYVS